MKTRFLQSATLLCAFILCVNTINGQQYFNFKLSDKKSETYSSDTNANSEKTKSKSPTTSFNFKPKGQSKTEDLHQSQTYSFDIKPKSSGYNFYFDPNAITSEEYITDYVRDSILIWQKKDEFEPTAQYRIRVTEQSRKDKIAQLTTDAEQSYIGDYYLSKGITFELDKYDADNESFLLMSKELGNIVLPVPLADARAFKESWMINNDKTKLYVNGNEVLPENLEFISNGKTFTYNKASAAVYARANISINLPSWNLDLATNKEANVGANIVTKNISVGLSDVDMNIPESKSINEDTFVIIIANENYIEESAVPYAVNDGSTFQKYCVATLGVPEKQIRFFPNATLNMMRKGVDFARMLPNAEELNLIFYYAGHGIPDEATKKSYLLPIDGYASSSNSGYSLDQLYQEIADCNFNRVTYFLDACFSGSKRDEGMLLSARGVAIKAREGELKGNSISFSASSGEQTAFPYEEKGHGLFTYFLLKKLQETKGDVSYQELGEYVNKEVSYYSVVNNNKAQNPTVTSSLNTNNTWQNYTFK